MIDLHLHTFYSDGTLSPTQLVKEAKKRGASCIAITDHDGISGLKEGMEASRLEGIELVCGIEFSAELWKEEDPSAIAYMHLLGYGIDGEQRTLRDATQGLLQTRKERNIQMMTALQNRGYEIDWQDLKVHPQQTYVGKPNFAGALVKKGYAINVNEVFQSEQMLKAPEIRGIQRVKIHVGNAIELVHQAGGKAVLAHPMKVTYRGKDQESRIHFWEQLGQLLDQLQPLGLDGMECYYSSHTKEETDILLSLADSRGLLVTAGSDFHGPELNATLMIGAFQTEIDESRLEWIHELKA